MADLFTQRFSVEIFSIRRHREYAEYDPKWIVQGELRARVTDYWAKEQTQRFKWGFYIVVGKDADGGFKPVKFENRDTMGTYSHFFRALVWKRLKGTVFLGLR